MADTTSPAKSSRSPKSDSSAATPLDTAAPLTADDTAEPIAKQRFAKAIEEARAGVEALGKQAQDTVGEYVGGYKDKLAGTSGQTRDKALDLAREGKSRATDALSALGKLVSDNAAVIDEKVGPRYGDYARTAARSIQDTATRLDAKDINEIGDDAREFVRNSPALAVGIAAAAGFVIARLFSGSND